MRLTVIKLVAAFICGLATAPLVVNAQQIGKLYRVGFLLHGSRELQEHLLQAFEQALHQRGWVMGQNLFIEYRSAQGKYDRLPALAAELVSLKPNVIVAVPTAATRAAKDATSTIPIVMWGVSDPIGEGLIASFARPGGNVTGLTLTPALETYAKQLQLLKEAVPRGRKIAFLWNSANPAAASAVRTIEQAARSLGIELQVVTVQAAEDFDPAFRAIAHAKTRALLILTDQLFLTHRSRLADLSLRHRLPSMYGAAEYAKAGGLMAHGVNREDAFRRVAGYVDTLLRGANPAELPVEQPTKFEFVINLKTAKALGVIIPQSLLLQADQVIE